MSADDINNYIKFKILKYRHYNFINNNLWEQYQENFIDFIEVTFKAYNLIVIYNLQTLLYYKSV